MQIPKHVKNDIRALEGHLERAYAARRRVESWAEANGADTSGTDWYDTVSDDTSAVSGLSLEGLEEYMSGLETEEGT